VFSTRQSTLCRVPNFTECGTRQSLLCRVPDKRHSAKRPTLGKASDSGSAGNHSDLQRDTPPHTHTFSLLLQVLHRPTMNQVPAVQQKGWRRFDIILMKLKARRDWLWHKTILVGYTCVVRAHNNTHINYPLKISQDFLLIVSALRIIFFMNARVLLTPFQALMTITRTGGGVLCTGDDGPRLGAGRSATWGRARVPCLTSRTVRVYAGEEVAGGAWISLPGGILSRRRDPRCCLGSAGRPRLL
jgi:hypothetical protein